MRLPGSRFGKALAGWCLQEHMPRAGTLALAECQNGNAVRPHTHPHAQLAIVLRGQCDYYVDGKPYRMKEGSWIFVPADVEHYIHVYDSDVPVMNLDVFFPERMEYVDAYDEFVAGLEEKQG